MGSLNFSNGWILLKKSVERRRGVSLRSRELAAWRRLRHYLWSLLGFEGGFAPFILRNRCDPPSRGGRLTSLASFRKF
jgi:hypothetical protein